MARDFVLDPSLHCCHPRRHMGASGAAPGGGGMSGQHHSRSCQHSQLHTPDPNHPSSNHLHLQPPIKPAISSHFSQHSSVQSTVHSLEPYQMPYLYIDLLFPYLQCLCNPDSPQHPFIPRIPVTNQATIIKS